MQDMPWRCPICCLGFQDKLELIAHYANLEHYNFTKAVFTYNFSELLADAATCCIWASPAENGRGRLS